MNSAVIYNNVPAPACMMTPISVATPDGGFLYTGFKCINYIAAPPANEKDKDIAAGAVEVKTMSTRITINALDVSPQWGKPTAKDLSSSKQFAIVAEDLSVQVWDCVLGEAIIGHKAHQHQHEARDARMNPLITVHMSYICNGNILSIDATDLVIYCVASNTYCRRPTFISPRNHQLTVLRCSPYNENIFALGTTAGIVMVCDLLKMNTVYKFNSQHASICDLAWREMPWRNDDAVANDNNNTEQWRSQPVKAPPPPPKATTAKAPLLKSKAAESDDLFDIYNFDHLESEFGAPSSVRPRLTSKSSDDCGDFVGLEKPKTSSSLDFIEACESMKADLKKLSTKIPDADVQVEVTLQDCQQSEVRGPLSDTNSNKSQKSENSGTLVSGSSEGSLEVLQLCSSSSDDAVIVDGEATKPKREVLHHIYHQAEVHVAPESPQQQIQCKQQLNPNTELSKKQSLETISSVGSPGRSDILLVSINANDITMIWNTLTGAHCGKNYSKANSAKSKEVYWLNDRTIVTLSRNQLFYWTLEYDSKMSRYKMHKDQVNKCSLQDIVTFAPSASSNEQIWVCSRNRKVCVVNPLSGQLMASYGCLSFGIRAISECPDDMNKIALGCSDKRIGLLDISKMSAHCIPIESVHVNSVIYSLAWSPDCLQLAFGTFDGNVGILDVESMRLKTTFRAVHKNEIYTLIWQDNYIYFIVNRVLCVYNTAQPKKDPIVLNYIERPSNIYVRKSFLFIGTEDGFLQLWERKPGADLAFANVRQTPLLPRYITEIAFNPLERNQFAVVGHDKLLYVMEFQEQQRSWSMQHTLRASDPKASITSVKWSNMQAHLLLSFHIEGKVCLWNLNEPKQPPLTITYHCPMWCGMFLPSDENIIMCSGKALSLELVSIKDALARNEMNICSKMDALLNVKWASKSLTQPTTATSAAQKKRQRREKRRAVAQQKKEPKEVAEQSVELSLEKKLDALTLDTRTKTNGTVECSTCKNCKSQPMPDNFLAHSRTCLCLTQKELNKSALEKLAIVLTEDAAQIDKEVLVSKLFSTKVIAKDLIAMELTNLKQSNNKDIAPLCLTVSTFKLREELQQHIENKTLNEWHLSVAPSVSYVFWQNCCSAYAMQMKEQGYILHAATYLMVIDQQTEAIDLLLKHEFFREALANARIHLPATDPMIKTIINKWLEQLEKTGNFAAAALICVLDNEMMRGYTYLRKIRNCTPEIADLMEQIKRIGQLGAQLDDSCLREGPQAVVNGNEAMKDEQAEVAA